MEKPANFSFLRSVQENWLGSSLVRKFTILFGVAGLLVAATSFLALQRILGPTFSSIESQVNAEQLARTRTALDEFNARLLNAVMDYAVWDDAYEYALKPDPAFEVETLSPVAYDNVNVDYIAIVRRDGTVVWSKAADRSARRFLDAESEQISRQVLAGPFAEKSQIEEKAGTIVRGSRGLYAIQSAWIRKSDGEGQPAGRFVMGRLLSESSLSNALQVKAVISLDDRSGEAKAILSSKDRAVSTILPDRIRNSLGLFDVSGQLQGTVSFSTPRRIAGVGTQALRSALIAMGLSLVALALLLAFGIHRLSVVRLQSLRQHVRRFRDSGQSMDPELLASSDEIGSLARQFESLQEELAEAEEELRNQAYVQGKADSAVGLLHNVRNSLGPLGVKYDKWCREDTLPIRSQLKLAIDELASGGCETKRRADLENFVKVATTKLIEMANLRAAEIGDMKESVDQIIAILADYDFSSSATPRMEQVNLRGIILREVRNREVTEGREIALELPEEMPPVWGNHIHLSQLIGNLIGNGVDAMRAAKVAEMRLRTACKVNAVGDSIEIAITDIGEGATQEVIAQAFERGFSTRRSKSGGMGLHWSANAARAMGGSLSLESGGIGMGATARLQLPSPPSPTAGLAQQLAA